MVRERAKDPYASGQERPAGSGLGFQDYLRYIVVGIATVLIVLGIGLGMSAFTIVRGIIEGPETLTAHLDAWVGASEGAQKLSMAEGGTEAAERVAPSAEAIEGVDGPEAEAAPVGVTTEANEQPRGRVAGPRDRARGASRQAEVKRDRPAIGFVDEFFQLLREGGMSRAMGALFILLFTLVLVRIPFSFLRAGIGLLSNVAFPKVK